jgi:hypothetical protein
MSEPIMEPMNEDEFDWPWPLTVTEAIVAAGALLQGEAVPHGRDDGL